MQELRLAFRLLRKNSGFTLVCVLALAIGIGANTAIFTMVNGILLRELNFKNAKELVWIWSTRTDRDKAFFSIPDFLDYQEQNRSLQEMAAFGNWGANLAEGSNPERLNGVRVTPNAFSLLGVEAAVGRGLQPDDGKPESPKTVVLSYALWQKRFAGEPGIMGKSVLLNGESYTVVGALPATFIFPGAEMDVATPLAPASDPRRSDRGTNFLRVFARMKPGATQQQVQSEMDSISRNLQRLYPEENAKKTPPKVFLLQDEMVGSSRTSLFLLLGAVGLVLLIACSNLANLLLARASTRRKEMAVRAALGASRAQLVQQMLTETALLVMVGGGLGLLLAWYALQFMAGFVPETLPRVREIGIDGTVLIFTLAVSCLAGLIFGLVPALQASKVDLNEELKGSGKGGGETSGRGGARGALVVAEIALSLMLLISAALLMKSFLRLQEVKPGFRSDHLLLVRLSLPPRAYSNAEAIAVFYDQVLSQIQTLPGVEDAGGANVLPLSGLNVRSDFTIAARPPLTAADKPAAQSRLVSADYFKALGIPIVKGRAFTPHDNAGANRVAVIDEALARRYWPDAEPIGAHLRIEDTPNGRDAEIVGIVGAVKHVSLDEPVTPTLYTPIAQMPEQTAPFFAANSSLAIRTISDPAALENSVRHIVRRVDANVPISSSRTMEQVISSTVAARRFNLILLSIFAATAVLLAMTGVYAVMSYAVTQRSPEIGIRMALGAQTRDVLRLVLGQGMKLVAIGLALGVAGALIATRFVASLLFGVSAMDPMSFLLAALVLGTVAGCASFFPARKAAKVDPVIALRGV
jgi:predicted permease